MVTKDQKEQIQQAKADRKVAKYSKDYDATLIINWIFGILAGIVLGVFIMEGISISVLDKEPGVYLTAAVILALLAYFAGWASHAVTAHFTKKAVETQQNGHTNKETTQ